MGVHLSLTSEGCGEGRRDPQGGVGGELVCKPHQGAFPCAHCLGHSAKQLGKRKTSHRLPSKCYPNASDILVLSGPGGKLRVLVNHSASCHPAGEPHSQLSPHSTHYSGAPGRIPALPHNISSSSSLRYSCRKGTCSEITVVCC